MVILVGGFWKLQWSIAGICERDNYDMNCFFSPWRGSSAGRATSFILSSRNGWVLHCFHCCGLRTLFGLVDEEHLQGIQQSS